MTGNIRRGNENESMPLKSCFGWVVSDYYESSFSTTTNSFTNLRFNANFYDFDYMKNDDNIFKLEKETFFNITSEQCESNESHEFIPQFKVNLMMRNNPYEVTLPIKDNLVELLPGNYLLTTHRLKGLRTPLCKDKGLRIQYNNISRII